MISKGAVLWFAASVAAAAEWPEFRGPTAQGHATATDLPIEWSREKNVAWRQAVPGSGWSSPVVDRGRIFLTTGVQGSEGGPWSVPRR